MQRLIDKSKRLPLYLQIAESLENQIKNGELSSGDALPPENELSQALGVSPVTVKNGLKLLVDKGLIKRISGRGTFVSANIQSHKPVDVAADVLMQGVVFGVVTLSKAEPDGWHGPVIAGLEQYLQATNNRLKFIPSGCKPRIDTESISGIVILSSLQDDLDHIVSKASLRGLPAVVVANHNPDVVVDCIECDHERAGREAALHLLSCGYTRLVHLTSEALPASEARCKGFLNELRVHGVQQSRVSVIKAGAGDDPESFGKNIADELPLINERLGIFACNDAIAAGFVTRNAEKGRAAGQAYGIIGCDDIPDYRTLGLTTLSFPYLKAGEIAAKRLTGLMKETPGTLQFSLWPTLIQRDSTSRSGSGEKEAERS